jgi:hypothetical protein
MRFFFLSQLMIKTMFYFMDSFIHEAKKQLKQWDSRLTARMLFSRDKRFALPKNSLLKWCIALG